MSAQVSDFAPARMRAAIQGALPAETSHFGEAPEPRYLYVPSRHVQALSPDRSLVVGIRGAGKSVWWSALRSQQHRELVASVHGSNLDPRIKASAGFGESTTDADYPNGHILATLLSKHYDPDAIWRTVVAWHTFGQGVFGDAATWEERTRWVCDHVEATSRAFADYDADLARRGEKHLILFDALDRAGDTWEDLRRLFRGLLQVLLEFRSSRAIRAKAFVRPDLLDDPEVTNFRDASKVTANQVELRWSRADLYGLLFQALGNAPNAGSGFRRGCEELIGQRWTQARKVWQVPGNLRDKEESQRAVFQELAGKEMGRDRRRGVPYTWLPGHLVDANLQASPRSFLAAVRHASEFSNSYGDSRALHYEGIKKGVQEASRIRVQEIKEDFPWVTAAMKPLEGLVIPCRTQDIDRRWREARTLDDLKKLSGTQGSSLPPRHLEGNLSGLRKDLLELGIFNRQPDKRINMPDVFRVGFGLGRKGGVRPIR